MTRFRSIVVTDDSVQFVEHKNCERAEEFGYRMRNDPDIHSFCIGNINGASYTVIYHKTTSL